MTKEECIALLERYSEYDGMGIPNLAGCREAMKMAADLFSQPSLPSNLDEAAEKYEEKYGKYLYGLSTAFKTGAKWMAEQGYTVSSGEPDAMGDIHTDWLGFSHVLWNWMVKTGFCKIPYNGDLVVQIRKKQ